METKYCPHCQTEKGLSEFGKNLSRRDGLQTWCKACTNEANAHRTSKKKEKLHKVYSNPDLSKFTPKQLMDELRSRGYSGELKYTQTIKL